VSALCAAPFGYRYVGKAVGGGMARFEVVEEAAGGEQAVQRIRTERKDAQVTGVPADLGTKEGVGLLIREVPVVDILVNNLGIFEPRPFEEISDEQWRRFFDVNVLSGVRLSRAYLGGMLKRNWGRVVFISSESALNIPKEMIHYGVTKTMQVALARGLAETTAGTGVTVNSVLAGPTRSEGVEEFIADLAKTKRMTPAAVEKEFFTTGRPGSLLQRFATPAEVAALVAFVASPLSSATNGAALRAEGGVVRSIF